MKSFGILITSATPALRPALSLDIGAEEVAILQSESIALP